MSLNNTCLSLQNSRKSSPCDLLTAILDDCGLNRTAPYVIPDFAQVDYPPSYCKCTQTIYNLHSACSFCSSNGVNGTVPWVDWQSHCHQSAHFQTNNTKFPEPVPLWAFAPSNYSGGVFNLDFSRNVVNLNNTGSRDSDLFEGGAVVDAYKIFSQASQASSQRTSTSVTPSRVLTSSASPSHTNATHASDSAPRHPTISTEATMGIIIGGVVSLALLALLACCWRTRRRVAIRVSGPHSEFSPPTRYPSSLPPSDKDGPGSFFELEDTSPSAWHVPQLSPKRFEGGRPQISSPGLGLQGVDPHCEAKRNRLIRQQQAILHEMEEKERPH